MLYTLNCMSGNYHKLYPLVNNILTYKLDTDLIQNIIGI